MLNYVAVASQKRVGTYFLAAPTYRQGRKIIWEGIRGDGRRFLDAFPDWDNPGPGKFVRRVRDDEMTLWLANKSVVQVIGAEDVDRLVGTNPVGLVLTEYSIHDPNFWEFFRPILVENGGWAVFIYTPRGRSHGYHLWQRAKKNERWYTEMLTVDDTARMSIEAGEPVPVTEEMIQEERDDGMSEALIQQEFFCSFDSPLEGSIYGDLVKQIELNNQITNVPYEPAKPVITGWDIGIGDYTAIVFAQRVAKEVRIIDYYQAHGKGFDHYAKVLREKPYVYSEHLAPHDMKVREWMATGGRARVEVAREFGIHFKIVRKLRLEDGIQACRALIPKCWIDQTRCETFVNALREYTKERDGNGEFRDRPKHDWTSHPCDAFRTLAVGWREEEIRKPVRLAPRLAIV